MQFQTTLVRSHICRCLLISALYCSVASAQSGVHATVVAPANPRAVQQPIGTMPVAVAPSTGMWYAQAPVGQAVYVSPPAAAWQPAVAPQIPAMPPPPNLAPPSLSSRVVLAQATTVAPPMVSAPPVAQGFGSNVPPAVTGAPAPVMAAPPYYGPVASAPGWGVATIVPNQYLKFVQEIRLRHTWLAGNTDPKEFGINDTEAAVTFAFPNFLYSQHPLLVSPGFILSLWDPSEIPAPLPAGFGQIPPRAYSAYIDFYWTPKLTERLTTELDFRIGVYSDFESVESEAIRPQGYGALVWQHSPAWAIKGGATYINRADIKLLPVAGLVYTPNPYTHFDITFPNPKLSHFAWRWGNADVWWYLAAEYGGGSWEIDNLGDNRMDINDIRAIGGLEWVGGWLGAKGFFELGYVFDREIYIAAAPTLNQKPNDTVMVRGGFSF